MNRAPQLHGEGFLVLANGERYAAQYALDPALAPIPKLRGPLENRRYSGRLIVPDYLDRVIPAAALLELEDGMRLPFRSCDRSTEHGVFAVQTRILAEEPLSVDN